MDTEKSFSLDGLLAWLDGDALEAGRKYVRFQKHLVGYLENHGAYTVAEELADKAFDRIDKKLKSPLLSEHFNSREIGDVLHLCRIIHDEAMQNLSCPGKRIWELLSSADQSLVTNIAKSKTPDSRQRGSLTKALNEIVRRRDFYCEENFDSLLSQTNNDKNLSIEKIKSDINRELSDLSQSEIEYFNRRLLETAFPAIVKKNLADTPDEEKLARCKRYARVVLLEYLKEPRHFELPDDKSDNLTAEGKNQNAAKGKPIDQIIEDEDEEEKRKSLEYLKNCKAKLSPRDCVVLDMYFTGIVIESPEDEPLTDEMIKIVRKRLAEKFDVAPETIRTIAHRSREFVRKCIERCNKRQEKI